VEGIRKEKPMLAILIILFLLVIPAGIFVAVLVVRTQSSAKKQAARMVKSGKIDDPKKAERTLKVLSSAKDLEAISLYQKLEKLLEES